MAESTQTLLSANYGRPIELTQRKGFDSIVLESPDTDLGTPSDHLGRTLLLNPHSRAKYITRMLPLICALLSTILAFGLLIGDYKDRLRYSGVCYDDENTVACWVENDRSSVAVFIQIIGTVLGFLWTFSVTSAFNLTVRAKLAHDHITIVDRLRLYVSISRKALDLSLPKWALLISVTFYGITFLPLWLWTGCLTPHSKQIWDVTDDTGIANTSLFPMPVNGNQLTNSCDDTRPGASSNCPDIHSSGDLINTLGQASNLSYRNVFGQPGLTAFGRHYGVGSSVSLSYSDALSISHQESGLFTNVSCMYNQSADWHIKPSFKVTEPNTLRLYWTDGKRPNDDWDLSINRSKTGYVLWDFNTTAPEHIVAFSVGGSGNLWNGTPPYQLSIAAGSRYKFLNKTQCDLTFTPWNFQVIYNTTAQLMTVKPSSRNNNSMPQFHPLVEMATRRLQGLTMIESSLYTSAIGNAMSNGIAKEYKSFNALEASDKLLPFIEMAITNVLDDILMALSSYSLDEFNQTQVETEALTEIIVIGSPKFHWGLVVINVVALLAIIAVMIWTKAFQHSPAFDFSDLVTMLVAAHNGAGTGNIGWDGDPGDKSLGKMRLDLRVNSSGGMPGGPHVKISRTSQPYRS